MRGPRNPVRFSLCSDSCAAELLKLSRKHWLLTQIQVGRLLLVTGMGGTLRAGYSRLFVRCCVHLRTDHAMYMCTLITDCNIGEVAAVLA